MGRQREGTQDLSGTQVNLQWRKKERRMREG